MSIPPNTIDKILKVFPTLRDTHYLLTYLPTNHFSLSKVHYQNTYLPTYLLTHKPVSSFEGTLLNYLPTHPLLLYPFFFWKKFWPQKRSWDLHNQKILLNVFFFFFVFFVWGFFCLFLFIYFSPSSYLPTSEAYLPYHFPPFLLPWKHFTSLPTYLPTSLYQVPIAATYLSTYLPAYLLTYLPVTSPPRYLPRPPSYLSITPTYLRLHSQSAR